MKKSFIAIVLSAILSCTVFSFCGCGIAQRYTLTVVGENDLLVESLDKSYAAGETVTVKTDIICDAVTVVKINGTPLQHTLASENGTYTHLEFTFTMPNKNSTLELTTENGFLPPPMGIDNTLAYYNLALSSNRDIAGLRMNAYVQSLSVWEQIKPLLPDFTKSYDDSFFDNNALLVLFGEKGNGADGEIESVDAVLNDTKLYITFYADYGAAADAPAVMTEWVVVLEVRNHIAFTEFAIYAFV